MDKILLIHHHGGIGGAGASFLDIVDSLKDDYKLTVVCPSYPTAMSDELRKRNIEVIEVNNIGILNYYNGGSKNILSVSSIKHIIKIFKSRATISKIIKEFEGNFVLVNSMTLSWIGFYIKKHSKIGVCFHRETYTGAKKIGTKIIKYFMKKYFERIVFISKYDFNNTPEIEDRKKSVIYDRVHKERFIDKNNKDLSNKEYINILYLGGFSELKGAKVAVEAMVYLKEKSNFRLLFVGDEKLINSKYRNPIRKFTAYRANRIKNQIFNFIQRNELEDKIIFESIVINPEKYYNKSDVIIFPSTLAHQSRPIYEAGFSKVPIIISDFENTKEFVENGITGFTFQVNRPQSLAEKIEYVLDLEPQIREAVIEENYKRTTQKHDFNSLNSELLKLLDKIK